MKSVFILLFFCIFVIPSLQGQTRYIDSLKSVLPKTGVDTNRVKIYTAISNKILTTNATTSRIYADSALALSKKLNYKDGEGNSYVRLGLAYHSLSQYATALENFNDGLSVFIALRDLRKQGKVYNNIGYTHMAMSEYKIAIENYFKAIDIAKKITDNTGLASAYTNAAIVFALQTNYELAEQYFQNAIQLFRKLKNEDMVYKNMLNISGIYKDKKMYQKSIEQTLIVKAYYTKKGNKSELARCLYILGANYKELRNYASAKTQFNEALKIHVALNNLPQIAGCKLRLSELSNLENDFELAQKEAKEALAIATETNAKATIFNSYKQLSEICFKMKDYETAYAYRLKFENMKDSVFNEESNNKINEIEARFQNKIKKNEIKDLQAANTINELKIKKQQNLKFVFSGIVLFVIIICLLLFNQYRVKRKSNEILLAKNNIIEVALGEKEVLLQEIHHRVKNNLQFVWSLLNMHTRHVKDKKALETLIEAKNRIKTMALIHQKLYQSDNLKGIDAKIFIPNLTVNLFETYERESRKIELETDIDPMVLDVDTAMPIALIINELVTNTLKYAFSDLAPAKLTIQLKKKDSHLLLSVQDNGKGFVAHEESALNESFGFKLIHSLAKQLKAEVRIKSDDGVLVEVKITKYQFA